ncbi:MAG: DUF1850 domain-containing protein [candidate division NC10 bacterium]|nr:DUF1850 domain-containing protein [candidate division NC10 bacterium]MBI4841609.1 DUF1850 domain-containing protein [candidate division NC10 bacterium]
MRVLLLLLAMGLLAPPLPAGARCLTLEAEGGPVASTRVEDGDEVRLRFLHSLWGSPVEEDFRITGEGLELVRLRYAERRLVEFYGHEAARRDGDWWVVEGDRRHFRALTLRANRESRMQLSVGAEKIPLWTLAASAGPIRLTVIACGDGTSPGEADGRAGRDP